jgi:hypothetical protein
MPNVAGSMAARRFPPTSTPATSSDARSIRPFSPLPPVSDRIVVERTKAAADTDTATKQTVEKMCEYIRAGAIDEQVKACADYAWRKFGMGLDNPALKCWAVFWWLKHSIKFRSDEATMFRVGEEGQQDLLIAPAVLARMKDPAEDCDGFTMMAAAMLSALGVPVVVATVAVDPRDPSRWSHVFPCALLPAGTSPVGNVLPLDASHGSGPGWMVPPARISRWQAWDLNARPVDVAPMNFQGLHGYRRTSERGMGDDNSFNDFPTGDNTATVSFPYLASGTPAPSGGGLNWGNFWQGLVTQGVNLTSRILSPPAYQQTVRDPVTGQLISTTVRNGATGATALTAGAGGLSPVILYGGLGLLGLLVVMSMSKGRG